MTGTPFLRKVIRLRKPEPLSSVRFSTARLVVGVAVFISFAAISLASLLRLEIPSVSVCYKGHDPSPFRLPSQREDTRRRENVTSRRDVIRDITSHSAPGMGLQR